MPENNGYLDFIKMDATQLNEKPKHSNAAIYQFKSVNNKVLWYLPLCFVGIFFIFLLPSHTSMFVFLSLIFGPMILTFVLMFKKANREEEIVLHKDYLSSKLFGQVQFNQIQSAKASRWVGPPNLYLKLKDGQKIGWAPGAGFTQFKSKVVLGQFINDFYEVVQQNTATNKAPAAGSKSTSSVADTGTPALATESNLSSDLKSVKKKNRQLQKIAIPIGLAMAIFLFIQRVIIPKVSEHKNDEVHQMFQNMRQHNEDLKDKAVKFAYDYGQKHGPFYLFTNDSLAYLRYLPKVFRQKFDGPLAAVPQSDSLEKLLAHPDSTQWNMLVYNGSEIYVFAKRRALNSRDSTETYVYLTVANPEMMLANPRARFGGADSISLKLSFAVPLYKDKTIKENLNNGIIGGSGMLLGLLRNHPETARLYMATNAEKGEMDKALFKKVVAVVKAKMAELKIDTLSFKIKSFGKIAD